MKVNDISSLITLRVELEKKLHYNEVANEIMEKGQKSIVEKRTLVCFTPNIFPSTMNFRTGVVSHIYSAEAVVPVDKQHCLAVYRRL
jgi:hypothetical protein